MAITAKQKQFIEKVGQLAATDMQKSGVSASLTIAQAILESGWGESGLTVKGNALFGIKAGTNWKGKVYSGKTKECYDGATYEDITATFRAYDSWEESVTDHSALLTGMARYKAVIGERDYKAACIAIKAAGYATDPTYSQKLINLIESYGLNEYDSAAASENGQAPAVSTGGTKKMNNKEFIAKLQNVVDNFKTLYVMGCFGAPITSGNVSRYCTNDSYNKQAARTAMIKAAANKTPPVFGFDCVCLIKGLLWGWNGDASESYGGATYASNGVPDIGADTMITKCTGVSTNFGNIVPGEAVWLPGHIGVYIGNGKVIECTPAFKNCVQVTACLNIGAISGMNGRAWTKHGKLPYITYEAVESTPQNTAEAEGNIYEVVSGDTLGKIAAKSGTTVSKLAEINDIANVNVISVGQIIMLNDSTNSAVEKLHALGIINSPDYWKGNYSKLNYTDALLVKAAKKIKAKGVSTASVEAGIEALTKAGIVSSPDYWESNYSKLLYCGDLIKALGGSV
jgi:LysM repeat protein